MVVQSHDSQLSKLMDRLLLHASDIVDLADSILGFG